VFLYVSSVGVKLTPGDARAGRQTDHVF